MRSSPVGTVIISASIAFAFASIVFANLSWAVASIAIAGAYIYAHARFASEIERTSLEISRIVLDELGFAGEPIGVKVEILNKDPVPVRAVFEDQVPKDCELSAGSNRSERVLPGRSILTLSYSLVPKRRGVHRIDGMRIERVDALGLLETAQLIDAMTLINAHTRKDSFDSARKIAGKEHIEFSGMARSPAIILRELEFDGIRDYVPGDRARDIHWKLLPKLGRLMTKTYKKEGSLQTLVFVDCGRSMRFQEHKISKIDHAVDLSMQLSNVLISSFHPAGVATFDETHVIGSAPPSLGRHQFEKIVALLRNVPDSIRVDEPGIAAGEQPGTPPERPAMTHKVEPGEGEEAFLSKIDSISKPARKISLGIGLEGAVKEALARSKGQELMFIIISDLISSREAVLAAAKTCQRAGSKMIVIQTYDDWYKRRAETPEVHEIEGLYSNLHAALSVEAALRGFGSSFVRIGPADTAAGIVRAIRRGKA